MLILKLWAKRKLKDIEGLYGTSKTDENRPGGNVLGSLGEDSE